MTLKYLVWEKWKRVQLQSIVLSMNSISVYTVIKRWDARLVSDGVFSFIFRMETSLINHVSGETSTRADGWRAYEYSLVPSVPSNQRGAKSDVHLVLLDPTSDRPRPFYPHPVTVTVHPNPESHTTSSQSSALGPGDLRSTIFLPLYLLILKTVVHGQTMHDRSQSRNISSVRYFDFPTNTFLPDFCVCIPLPVIFVVYIMTNSFVWVVKPFRFWGVIFRRLLLVFPFILFAQVWWRCLYVFSNQTVFLEIDMTLLEQSACISECISSCSLFCFAVSLVFLSLSALPYLCFEYRSPE